MLIGLNLAAVVLIVFLYFRMFAAIKSDRRFARPALPEEKKKREDVVLAFRFFAIVLTDCLCWLPIIAVKLLAFTDASISRESRRHFRAPCALESDALVQCLLSCSVVAPFERRCEGKNCGK